MLRMWDENDLESHVSLLQSYSDASFELSSLAKKSFKKDCGVCENERERENPTQFPVRVYIIYSYWILYITYTTIFLNV